MSGWLDPLRRTLDIADTPVTFFFRDDDAGWSDARLYRILDIFERRTVPIDLAVIPIALGQQLARRLTERMRDAPGRMGLHQHGFAHVNHEPSGRKCEFGPSRDLAQMVADLRAGKRRLEDSLGPVLDPIFTPPWNRCTQETADALASAEYRVLSRDITASSLRLNGLQELPVSVDWCRWEKHYRGRVGMGMQIAAFAGLGLPVGIMLHHADMRYRARVAADKLLSLLAGHPNAHCKLMRSVAGVVDSPIASSAGSAEPGSTSAACRADPVAAADAGLHIRGAAQSGRNRRRQWTQRGSRPGDRPQR